MYSVSPAKATGAPREITPQQGDTFTILETWMDLDSERKVTQVATQEGGTLTFGDRRSPGKSWTPPRRVHRRLHRRRPGWQRH